MTANTTELAVAVRSLTIFETSLRALQEQLWIQNPELLEVTSPAYERRIAALRLEIAQYLGEHPSAVCLGVDP